jgi:hypothetical protein
MWVRRAKLPAKASVPAAMLPAKASVPAAMERWL